MAKKYKNRDSKDLNEGYTLVKKDNLEQFTGNSEEFLKKITHLKPGYLIKKKGISIIHLWWEDKDSWFMNIGTQTNNKFSSSGGWVIAKDMSNWMACYIKEDYNMYFRK